VCRSSNDLRVARPHQNRSEEPPRLATMNAAVKHLVISLLSLGFALQQRPAWAQSPAPSTVDSTEDNALLRPGDIIKLNVWREPDWSGEFAVDEMGVAVLPRLGPVKVTDMTAPQLKRLVLDSLGRFLRNPSIEVIPLRRIQVLGSVRTPGLYPVSPTVTIGDVVAMAGGATSEGKLDQVILKRDGKDLLVKLSKATRLADTPVRTGDQLYVPQRGWISRNAGLFVAAGLSATTTLIVALLVR